MGNSPLYHKLKKTVDDECQRLITEKINPWLNLKVGLKVKKHNGKIISYGGVEFDGSPQNTFWGGFMEPFLEEFILRTLDGAVKKCEENKLPPEKSLKEAVELLKKFVTNIYRKMAKVDQTLMGKGYPDRVLPRKVDGEIARMSNFINDHVNSELALWKSRHGKKTAGKQKKKKKLKGTYGHSRADPDGKISDAIKNLKVKKVAQGAVPYKPEINRAITGTFESILRSADYRKETGQALSTIKTIIRKIYNSKKSPL